MSCMYNENYVQCEFVKVRSHVTFMVVSTSTSLTVSYHSFSAFFGVCVSNNKMLNLTQTQTETLRVNKAFWRNTSSSSWDRYK